MDLGILERVMSAAVGTTGISSTTPRSINVAVIHNTYRTTVVRNDEMRVSSNGGRGGINAHATPEQEAAARERNVAAVAAQIFSELGENLIKASSGREALDHLLRTNIAVVLLDVSMPDLDGFELADLIHQHPRFQKTAIIFISAVHLTDLDRLKGYSSGAVDYYFGSDRAGIACTRERFRRAASQGPPA
jgi:CheY-like chemotaxis protein